MSDNYLAGISEEFFNNLNLTVFTYEEFKKLGSLDNLSYEDYINKFPIFDKLLQTVPGKDQHHIIPISLQAKRFNEKNSTSMSAEDFRSLKGEVDDRNIRCTKFEHLLCHYLAARDLKGDYLRIWNSMKAFYSEKISEEGKTLLENLKDWSDLSEKANERHSLFMKEYYESLDEPGRQAWRQRTLEVINTPETKEKISKRVKAWYASLDEGVKQMYQEKRTQGVKKAAERISLSLNNYNASLLEEERNALSERQKLNHSSDTCKKRCSEGQLRRFKSETEEEKEIRKEKHRAAGKKLSESLTEEDLQRLRERSIKLASDPEYIEKLRQSQQLRRSQEDPEKRRVAAEKIKRWKTSMKEAYEKQKKENPNNYKKWNDFQKEFKLESDI